MEEINGSNCADEGNKNNTQAPFQCQIATLSASCTDNKFPIHKKAIGFYSKEYAKIVNIPGLTRVVHASIFSKTLSATAIKCFI